MRKWYEQKFSDFSVKLYSNANMQQPLATYSGTGLAWQD